MRNQPSDAEAVCVFNSSREGAGQPVYILLARVAQIQITHDKWRQQ